MKYPTYTTMGEGRRALKSTGEGLAVKIQKRCCIAAWNSSAGRFVPVFILTGVPKIIHYGLEYNVGNWTFDKHWYGAEV